MHVYFRDTLLLGSLSSLRGYLERDQHHVDKSITALVAEWSEYFEARPES